MVKRLEVMTTAAQQLIDITSQVKAALRNEKMSSGLVTVYVPHTTCGVLINENADPDVREDIIDSLERLVPAGGSYRHAEGNGHAHIKAALLGASVSVFVESSTLVLGTWQGIFLAEFDGPRQRSILLKMHLDAA